MKGYYSFLIDRVKPPHNRSNQKYKLTVLKRMISFDDLPELYQKMNNYYSNPNENDYVDEHWFVRQNVQTTQVFSVTCNHITAWRIRNLLSSKISKKNENNVDNIWDYSFNRFSLEKIAMNAHEFFDHEAFLFSLQETLKELPKRTFSPENKQKVIESYMSNL